MGVGGNVSHMPRQHAAGMLASACREHEGCGPCRQLQLAEFLDWWEQRQQQHCQQQQQQACAGVQALQIQQAAAAPAGTADVLSEALGPAHAGGAGDAAQQAPAAAAPPPAEGPLWYVKDWHLASEFPQYQAYRCPTVFADDWLNEWYDASWTGAAQQAGVPRGQARQGVHHSAEQQHPQQHPQQPQHSAMTADYRFVYLGPQARGPAWLPQGCSSSAATVASQPLRRRTTSPTAGLSSFPLLYVFSVQVRHLCACRRAHAPCNGHLASMLAGHIDAVALGCAAQLQLEHKRGGAQALAPAASAAQPSAAGQAWAGCGLGLLCS